MISRREFVRSAVLVSGVCMSGCRLTDARADTAALARPTPAQLAWHEKELGMFFHFDIRVFKQDWKWRTFKDFPDPDGNLWVPGECDVPVRNHDWFWKPGREKSLYSLEHLVEMYYNSVGRNCNLLLNANINTDGLVPEADFRRYVEFGREIKRRFSVPVAGNSGEGMLVDLDLEKISMGNHVVIMEKRVRTHRAFSSLCPLPSAEITSLPATTCSLRTNMFVLPFDEGSIDLFDENQL